MPFACVVVYYSLCFAYVDELKLEQLRDLPSLSSKGATYGVVREFSVGAVKGVIVGDGDNIVDLHGRYRDRHPPLCKDDTCVTYRSSSSATGCDLQFQTDGMKSAKHVVLTYPAEADPVKALRLISVFDKPSDAGVVTLDQLCLEPLSRDPLPKNSH